MVMYLVSSCTLSGVVVASGVGTVEVEVVVVVVEDVVESVTDVVGSVVGPGGETVVELEPGFVVVGVSVGFEGR